MRAERPGARLTAGLGSILPLFGIMLAVDANQTVPTTGLSAHWPFDSATTPSPDVSGNANNATLTNGPKAVAALFGNGLNFDGTNDYAQAAAATSLDTGTNS